MTFLDKFRLPPREERGLRIYGDPSSLVPDTLEEYHQRRWEGLDPELRDEAVGYLLAELPDELLKEVRSAYRAYGEEWMNRMHEDWDEEDRMFYTFHFSEGMGIRNLLRDIIKDNQLPSGNWDDYYVEALLRAAGCR